DFSEPLASDVRSGRRKEFEAAYAVPGAIADPLSERTFRSAVLEWDGRSSPAGRRRLSLVRELLEVRQREIAPHLRSARFGSAQYDGRVLQAHWPLGESDYLCLLANLA